MEDERIIELFWARDESALDEVARRFGGQLMSVARGITQDSQDAEECVNDTYLAAWQAIPPARPRDLSAYLCRIVHNHACHVIERRTAKCRTAEILPLTDELAAVLGTEEYDPTRASLDDDGELDRAIDSFLRTLPREARVFFVRRYFYADDIERIAELCGVKEGRVYTSLSRTRKKLRVYLLKKGFEL